MNSLCFSGRDILHHEFGLKFAEAFGYPRDLIRPILMADLAGKVARGRDCSLKTDKIMNLGFQPMRVGEGLAGMIKRHGYYNEFVTFTK